MWIVVGTKEEYAERPGGLRVPKACPVCKRTCTFFEVIPRKYITIYWLPVIPTGNGESVLECEGCHKRFKMSASDRAVKASPPPARKADPAEEDRITVNCPSCAGQSRVPLLVETIRVTCPRCKHKFEV